MDFMDVLENRRSIRKFFPKPIEMEKIGILVTAASKAPSVGDLQPWKFIVVTKAAKLQAIADACPFERWLYQAPLVIVVCSMEEKVEQYYPGMGRLWAAQSCAAAAQNLLLTCVELDLAGCWVSSFETEKIKEVLHVPTGIEPHILIGIGYPDEEVPKKRLLPTDMNVYFNDFGATNVDSMLYKKDYGLYFRGRADDLKTRAAYETAERGSLRMGVENATEKVKSFFKRGKGGGGARNRKDS
jgi:nitroreductase